MDNINSLTEKCRALAFNGVEYAGIKAQLEKISLSEGDKRYLLKKQMNLSLNISCFYKQEAKVLTK